MAVVVINEREVSKELKKKTGLFQSRRELNIKLLSIISSLGSSEREKNYFPI